MPPTEKQVNYHRGYTTLRWLSCQLWVLYHILSEKSREKEINVRELLRSRVLEIGELEFLINNVSDLFDRDYGNLYYERDGRRATGPGRQNMLVINCHGWK